MSSQKMMQTTEVLPTLPTRTLSVVVAIGLLAAVSWATMGGPGFVAPGSFAVLILYFMGGQFLALSAAPTAFLLWSLNLLFFSRPLRLPWRSLLLLLLMSLACLIWFVGGWRNGIDYGGLTFATFWAIFNALLAAALFFFARRLRRYPSWWGNLAFHWLLFAWPAYAAFPSRGWVTITLA